MAVQHWINATELYTRSGYNGKLCYTYDFYDKGKKYKWIVYYMSKGQTRFLNTESPHVLCNPTSDAQELFL